jgi:hypothetical protein
MATSAGRQGSAVSVVDMANFEALELLYSAETQEAAYGWALRQPPGLAMNLVTRYPLNPFTLPTHLRKRQAAAYQHLGERLVARVEPHAVYFKVDARKDLSPTLLAMKRVRALRPRSRIFALGSLFQDPSILNRAVGEFDAVLLGDVLEVDRLCDSSDRGLWREIPNLAYYDGARFTLTRPQPSAPGQGPGGFDPEKFLYTAPAAYSKIRVFDVLAVQSGVGSSSMGPGTTRESPRDTGVAGAIGTLSQRLDTNAFCIRSSDGEFSEGLDRALLAAGLRICYATSLDPGKTPRTRLGLLAASGCAAVDIPVCSGSQRLLDTFYQRDYTVTQVERLARAARFAGLFTSMQFTFPCAEDDYHTEDETLRLIRRANPSAAVISPIRTPGTAQTGLLAQEFSALKLRSRARARRQCAALGSKVRELPVPLGIDADTALVAGLAGYRGRESAFVELAGLQLLSGDTTGLAEMIEQINDAARKPARVGAFRPLTIAQNAAAN